VPLLELARRRNQISEEKHQQLRAQVEEIGKMLNRSPENRVCQC